MDKLSPTHIQWSPIRLLQHGSFQRRSHSRVAKQIQSDICPRGWSRWGLANVAQLKRGCSQAAMRITSAPSTPGLYFRIHIKVEFGVMLQIVGSAEELGEWDPKKGVSFEWTQGNIWKLDIPYPACGYFEYKLIAYNTFNDSVYWEPCENRTLEPQDVDLGVSLTWGEQEALLVPKPETNFVSNITEAPFDLPFGTRGEGDAEPKGDGFNDLPDFPVDIGQSSIVAFAPDTDDVCEDEEPGTEAVSEDVDPTTLGVPDDQDTVCEDEDPGTEAVAEDIDPTTLGVSDDQDDLAPDSYVESPVEDSLPEVKSPSNSTKIDVDSEGVSTTNEESDNEDNSEEANASTEPPSLTTGAVDISTKSKPDSEDNTPEDSLLDVSQEPSLKPGLLEQNSEIGSDQLGCLEEQEGRYSSEGSLTPQPETNMDLSTSHEGKKTDNSILSVPQDDLVVDVGSLPDDAPTVEREFHESINIDPSLTSDSAAKSAPHFASEASKPEFEGKEDDSVEDTPLKFEAESSVELDEGPTSVAPGGDDECVDSMPEFTKDVKYEESTSTPDTTTSSSVPMEDNAACTEVGEVSPDAGNAESLGPLQPTDDVLPGSEIEPVAVDPSAEDISVEKTARRSLPTTVSTTAAIAVSSAALGSLGLGIYDALVGGIFIVGLGFLSTLDTPRAKKSSKETKVTESSAPNEKTKNLFPTSKLRKPETPGVFVSTMFILIAAVGYKLLHKREESEEEHKE